MSLKYTQAEVVIVDRKVNGPPNKQGVSRTFEEKVAVRLDLCDAVWEEGNELMVRTGQWHPEPQQRGQVHGYTGAAAAAIKAVLDPACIGAEHPGKPKVKS